MRISDWSSDVCSSDLGGFSPMLRTDLLRFNGGLFKDASAIEVTGDDLALLLLAAEHEWQNVEPAIFGTLLERALDPQERHRLGAHYTPRAYVERDRQSGVQGKRVSVRVDSVGRRSIKKNNKKYRIRRRHSHN